MSDPLRLTDGERLWVWMRRGQLTTAMLAERWGVRERTVTDWLKDREPREEKAKGVKLSHVIVLGELTPGEKVALWRRRSGLTLREAARRLGVSHVTLIRREREGGEGARELLRRIGEGGSGGGVRE